MHQRVHNRHIVQTHQSLHSFQQGLSFGGDNKNITKAVNYTYQSCINEFAVPRLLSWCSLNCG